VDIHNIDPGAAPPAPAPALSAPTVSNVTATATGMSSARLTATVNPGALPAQVLFAAAPGQSGVTPAVTASPSGAGTQPLTVTLNGLSANATYRYQVTATSAAGVTVSPPVTFTARPHPPTVSLLNVTHVTASSAQVTALVNSSGATTSYALQTSTNATTWHPAGAPAHLSSGQRSVTFTLRGLPAHQTETVQVGAVNAGGAVSARHTFTTLPDPPSLSPLTVSHLTSSSAQVSGTVNSSGARTTYMLQYSANATTWSTTAAQSLAAGSRNVTWPLRGLAAHRTYYLQVTATNAGGSTRGTRRTLQTLSADRRAH
jgi:hypothetical protein